MINKKVKKIIGRIINYTKKYNIQIICVFIFSLASSITTLISPYMVGKIIDNVVGIKNVNFEFLKKNVLFLFFIYILNSLSIWLLTSFSIFVSNNIVKDMREDAFNKITKLPINFFDNTTTGDLMSKFSNDIEGIAEGLLQTITQLFSAIITIIVAGILMIRIDFKIAFVVIIIAPASIIIATLISKNSSYMFRKQQDLIGIYNGFVEESISNLKIVKAFNYEKSVEKQSTVINNELYKYGQKAQWFSSLVNPSTRFINNIAYVFIGLIGGLSALKNSLSIGSISSLLIYSNHFAKPLNEITGIATQLQTAIASAERFFSLLDEKEEENENEKSQLENIKGEIKFSHVNFSYSENIKLIENLNVTIPAGSKVAIVGPTGAGKTTLVNLLMRFYETTKGFISIDNIPIKNIKRESIRLSFGMVLQDTWLFSGTIKENIAYGKRNATNEEIINVGKLSKADNFIRKLEKGYDTIILENGKNLSQGEKQLLTIGRAMLGNSNMLILDEATSSIDPRTEILIQDALIKLMENKTSFIIAHRLSTIIDSDIILVMNLGQIIEIGNHQQLLNKKGFYYELYNSQFKI